MLGKPDNLFQPNHLAFRLSHRAIPGFVSWLIISTIVCLLSSVGIGCSTVPTRDDSPVQKVWQGAVAKGFSGGAIVVSRTKTLLFETRNSSQSPSLVIHPSTPLPLCSVTKAMTAEIVFDLIDAGKLSLDGTLKSYLPWIPSFAENITIRQLLTHTSGLRNMDKAMSDGTNGVSKIYLTFDESWQPLKARISGIIGDQVAAPAGTKYDYNNTDFLMLQAILEHASRQTFEELLSDHVFTPAGMRHSHLAPWSSAKASFVDCYEVDSGKETKLDRFNMAIYGGAAGAISTPEDLVNWMKFMLVHPSGRQILMSGSQFGGFQGFGGYAYRSSFVQKKHSVSGDEVVYERPGAVNGYTLQVSFLPDRGVAVAAFSNRAGEKLGSVFEGSGLVADLVTAACASSLPSTQAPGADIKSGAAIQRATKR